jgi:hypothetical protein
MSTDNPPGRKTTVGASLLAKMLSTFASKLDPARRKTKMDNPE